MTTPKGIFKLSVELIILEICSDIVQDERELTRHYLHTWNIKTTTRWKIVLCFVSTIPEISTTVHFHSPCGITNVHKWKITLRKYFMTQKVQNLFYCSYSATFPPLCFHFTRVHGFSWYYIFNFHFAQKIIPRTNKNVWRCYWIALRGS